MAQAALKEFRSLTRDARTGLAFQMPPGNPNNGGQQQQQGGGQGQGADLTQQFAAMQNALSRGNVGGGGGGGS